MTIQKVLNNVADSVSQYMTKASYKAEAYGHKFMALNDNEKLAVVAKTAVAAGAAGIIGATFCPVLTGVFIVGGAGFGFKHSMDSYGWKTKLSGTWSHVQSNPNGAFSNFTNGITNIVKRIAT